MTEWQLLRARLDHDHVWSKASARTAHPVFAFLIHDHGCPGDDDPACCICSPSVVVAAVQYSLKILRFAPDGVNLH